MDEETKTNIQTKLLDYMTSIEHGVEKLVDFSSEQVPLLVQEIITYNIIYGIIYATLQIALATAMCIFARILYLNIRKITNSDGVEWLPAILIPALSIGPLTHSVDNILYACKAYFAPRLFMLEYIKDFIN